MTSYPSAWRLRATARMRESLSPSRKPAGSTPGSEWLSSTRSVPPISPTGIGASSRPYRTRNSSSSAQRLAGEVAEFGMVALGLQLRDHDDREHDLVLVEAGQGVGVGQQHAGVEYVRAPVGHHGDSCWSPRGTNPLGRGESAVRQPRAGCRSASDMPGNSGSHADAYDSRPTVIVSSHSAHRVFARVRWRAKPQGRAGAGGSAGVLASRRAGGASGRSGARERGGGRTTGRGGACPVRPGGLAPEGIAARQGVGSGPVGSGPAGCGAGPVGVESGQQP